MPKREWDVPEGALVLTQSTITSLEISPCRVTTLPKGFRTEPSIPMFQGTVEHALAEYVIKGGEAITDLKNIEVLAEELWSVEPHVPGKSLKAKLKEEGIDLFDWLSMLSMLFQAWVTGPWGTKYSDMDLVEAEVPRARHLFDHVINGDAVGQGSVTPVYLATGGVDAVFKDRYDTLHVVDWKTAGRAWGKNDGHGLIQDDIYFWLLEEDYDMEHATFTFEVGAFDRLEWRSHPTSVTPASIASSLVRAEGWAGFLLLENRPHLCTPLQMKQRGWWARPNYNHGHCPTCRVLGDEYDIEWTHTPPAPLIATPDNGEA